MAMISATKSPLEVVFGMAANWMSPTMRRPKITTLTRPIRSVIPPTNAAITPARLAATMTFT
jgi:hypothetical protein